MSAYTSIMVCVPVVPTDTYVQSHTQQEGNQPHPHTLISHTVSCAHITWREMELLLTIPRYHHHWRHCSGVHTGLLVTGSMQLQFTRKKADGAVLKLQGCREWIVNDIYDFQQYGGIITRGIICPAIIYPFPEAQFSEVENDGLIKKKSVDTFIWIVFCAHRPQHRCLASYPFPRQSVWFPWKTYTQWTLLYRYRHKRCPQLLALTAIMLRYCIDERMRKPCPCVPSDPKLWPSLNSLFFP